MGWPKSGGGIWGDEPRVGNEERSDERSMTPSPPHGCLCASQEECIRIWSGSLGCPVKA
jgi:hypothetical protein